MESDPAREWLSMQQIYSQMKQDELENIAAKAYELTDVAKKALEMEIKRRQIEVALELQPPDRPERPPMHTEEEFLDLALVPVYRAFSANQAQMAASSLDKANIPWRFGPDNLDRIDDFRGSYEDGVNLKVQNWDYVWAKRLMPAESQPAPSLTFPEGPVLCPACHSDQVVLDSAEQTPSNRSVDKFNWHCEACGHKWQDDGVEAPDYHRL